MFIKPDRIFPIFIRNGVALFLFLIIIGITISVNFDNVYPPQHGDEQLYKDISNNFSVEYMTYLYNNGLEAKPISFSVLQKVLNGADPLYTRGFSFILVFLSTILIYKITNNKFSFLYPMLVIFLDSLWLTSETIEVFFILLSIQYANRSGIFIGVATIFRPLTLIYSILLPKKQILNVLIIGILFALVLLGLGLFFPYLHMITVYANDGFVGVFLMLFVVLMMLAIMGLNNKKMFPYVIISAIPLYVGLFSHYFLPVYTFLFVGYLLNMNNDLKEMNLCI